MAAIRAKIRSVARAAGRAARALFHWRYRSSVTGEFITRAEAEADPAHTQRERAE